MKDLKDKIEIEIFSYDAPQGAKEYHVMVHHRDASLPWFNQMLDILDGLCAATAQMPPRREVVFRRFFLSDATNQEHELRDYLDTTTPTSFVQQPPLNGSKIGLWAYVLTNVDVLKAPHNEVTLVKHGDYEDLWAAFDGEPLKDTYAETKALFARLKEFTNNLGQGLAGSVLRTWFFVQNIDVNYGGMVKARNEVFADNGLTPDTHFIASTGIEGRRNTPDITVSMDAVSCLNIRPEQIQYLHGATHLNPTHEYGVSFERGTCVKYGDRRHVYISGTASIDKFGAVRHHGDIRQQTDRMLENVGVLLAEAECTFEHVGQMIIYLRDMADYQTVRRIFDERFPGKPKMIVLAPVCRPGWLIEMECIAVKADSNPEFPNF